MYSIHQSFVFVTIFNIVLYVIVHYPETLFSDTKSTFIEDQLIPNREGMVDVMFPICHLYIIFLFVNVFSSSVFFHSYYRCRLNMDESTKEAKVKCCAECAVIRYIFSTMYGKK
jgi:hypothetical protein